MEGGGGWWRVVEGGGVVGAVVCGVLFLTVCARVSVVAVEVAVDVVGWVVLEWSGVGVVVVVVVFCVCSKKYWFLRVIDLCGCPSVEFGWSGTYR